MSKFPIFFLFLSIFSILNLPNLPGVGAIKPVGNLTLLAPGFILSERKKPATAVATPVCPAPSICHSRNCCTYICVTGDDCVMITGKPFCLTPVPAAPPIPANAAVCVEDRCSGCPVNSIHCNVPCGTAAPAGRIFCDFSNIRGPLPAIG
ncbi:uncharacterized protein LOC110859721 [Folsomia candida]|uniref:Uncharacterized protein n=1 Tax=Folsomia candida TaxID=158441 RepID=A0A226DB82_FOLCA|nr:uncharacterized protein LOC110859721 [Folsomia candida]OXA42104.1 hypothetical protein Fcan01_23053 [Folsomia candida]